MCGFRRGLRRRRSFVRFLDHDRQSGGGGEARTRGGTLGG
jgi:hypothetical protein